MLVRMKTTVPGSNDGINVKMYEAGVEYELKEKLAEVFLSEGFAEAVDLIVEDEKGMGSAPVNKMASIPENKEEVSDKKKGKK